MDPDELEPMRNNIYSEPMFPISQIGSSSVDSSTQATQTQMTQESTCATQVGGGGAWRSRRRSRSDDDDEGSEGEESESPDFQLDDVVVRASKITEGYCTTGCSILDGALKGGIPTFGITELYGEAGTGKTQLCLQLALCAQLSQSYGGLDSAVYYICTEDKFPSNRLAELVQHFQESFPTQLPDDPMLNIFVEHIAEAEELIQCIEVKLAQLAKQTSGKRIRLVVIDSVAAIFRSEFDDLSQRTFELRRLAQGLHEYMYDQDAAIVVCNQVTGSPTLEGNIASLGMAWENMITTRIRLDKSHSSQRNLSVTFSPHIPSIAVPFQVSAVGVRGDQSVSG